MSYLEDNETSRARLISLVDRLTDQQLAMETGDGWTVSSVLVHLAFWDNRGLNLIKRWKKTGVGHSPIDIDNVNDAMLPLCLAIPAHEAVRLVISAAQAVDAELAHLPKELKPGIEDLVREGKFRLNRSLHRNVHLDQIERSISP